ncbi:MAG: tetratricopeptide repeat protein [Steroidobacterales bacterium]
MTLFIVVAGLMVTAGIVVLAWPLLKARGSPDKPKGFAPGASVALAAGAVIALVLALYPSASNWHWQDAEDAAAGRASAEDPALERLEDRLRESPGDVDGWLALGRAYTSRHRYYRAADAFERSLDLTGGENVEGMLGLGESLALADQNALVGRAGELLDRAARLEPTNPRALWWGGAAAYQRNDFSAARDRWQKFLATNPPPEIAQILKVKLAEIDQQLGTTAGTAVHATASARVRVKIDLPKELKPAAGMLFVLARHPGEAGPPLAVKRLPLGAWPVEVELTEADSMMPGRTLSPNDEVQVVARISTSGTAAPTSGDSYGEVRYHVGRDGLIALRIDKKVE